MNGSYVHEQIIDELDAAFVRQGIRTARQVLAARNRRKGFIDLVAFARGGSIAIEVERVEARLARDLMKAMDIDAAKLWIVVPNDRIGVRVRRRLATLQVRETEFLSVLALGQSLKAVTQIT